jgi:hypothetical protein
LSNPLYSYFSHFPSIYFFGQNHGLGLCVRGHLGKIIIYSNVQPIYFGLFGACFSWQGGNKFPKSTLKLGLEKVSVQVRKRRQRKLPSWAKLGAVNSNNFQLPSPHSPFGTQGQVHALERMAGVDAVGFGFTACENLLLGRHLQLQHDCLWLPRSIRKEEGRGLPAARVNVRGRVLMHHEWEIGSEAILKEARIFLFPFSHDCLC